MRFLLLFLFTTATGSHFLSLYTNNLNDFAYIHSYEILLIYLYFLMIGLTLSWVALRLDKIIETAISPSKFYLALLILANLHNLIAPALNPDLTYESFIKLIQDPDAHEFLMESPWMLVAGIGGLLGITLLIFVELLRIPLVHSQRLGIVIVAALLGGDLLHFSKLGLREITTQSQSSGPKSYSTKSRHVYHLILDEMPANEMVEELSYQFLKNRDAGLNFKNAYSNSVFTTISVEQVFSGSFRPSPSTRNAFLQELHNSGVLVSVYMPNPSQGCAPSAIDNCYNYDWLAHRERKDLNWLQTILLKFSRVNDLYFKRIRLSDAPDGWQLEVELFFDPDRGIYKSSSVLLLNAFKETIDDASDISTYTYIHLNIPHAPFIHEGSCKVKKSKPIHNWIRPEGRYNPEFLKNLTCADQLAQEFIQILKDKKAYDNSFVIVSSDHGPRLPIFFQLKQDEDLEAEADSLELASRIPLWIKPPGMKEKIESEEVVTTMDLVRTLKEFYEIPHDDHENFNLTGLPEASERLTNRTQIPVRYQEGDDSHSLFYRNSDGVWERGEFE